MRFKTTTILFMTLFFILSCGDTVTQSKNDDEIVDNDSSQIKCVENETQCVEDVVQKCVSSQWKEWDDCAAQDMKCVLKQGIARCVEQTDTGNTVDDADSGDTGDTIDDADSGDSVDDTDTGDTTEDADSGDSVDDIDTGDTTEDADSGDSVDDTDTGDSADDADTGNSVDDSDSGDTLDDSDAGNTGDDADTGNSADDTDIDEINLAEKVVGVWAQKLTMFAVTNDDVVGEIDSTTWRYLRIEIAKGAKNGELILTKQICQVDNDSGSGLTSGHTIFPQTFNDIYHYWKPADTIPGTPDALIVETGGSFQYVEGTTWELRGMQKMPNVITDLMPTDNGDVRIMDQDSDSHPGVTISFEGTMVNGDIYYVQRLSQSLTANLSVDNNKIISATLPWTDEQYTIDATNATLKGQKTTVTDSSKSSAIMVRIDAEKDCAAIYAEKDILFE